MYTVICTSVLETRTAPDQSLTYCVKAIPRKGRLLALHSICVESFVILHMNLV